MKNSFCRILYLPGLICGLAGTMANATTWNYEGIVDECNPAACMLVGITVSGSLDGFISADDSASGPGSAFTESDITNYRFTVQGVMAEGALFSVSVTTDADNELSSGHIVFLAEPYKRGGGSISLFITIDVATSTWLIETDYLDLGFVASGNGQWSLQVEDEDGDGLPTMQDNCTLVANPAQRDSDADGIGNFCDPDFNNSCSVDFADVAIFKADFLSSGDLGTDLDGDGFVGFLDLAIVKAFFLAPPGPSGRPNSCD